MFIHSLRKQPPVVFEMVGWIYRKAVRGTDSTKEESKEGYF